MLFTHCVTCVLEGSIIYRPMLALWTSVLLNQLSVELLTIVVKKDSKYSIHNYIHLDFFSRFTTIKVSSRLY